MVIKEPCKLSELITESAADLTANWRTELVLEKRIK